MHANDSRHPSRASFGARDFDYRTIKFARMEFAAAPSGGLKAADNARLNQILPGRVGQASQLVGFGGVLAERWRKGFRARGRLWR